MKTTFTRSHAVGGQKFRKNAISGFAFFLFTMFSLQSVDAQSVYAISASGNLINFNATSPGTIISSVPFTGITAGQVAEGLDFRPATGQLYALGYNATNGEARLYTVKPATGVATPLGSAITLATGITNLSVDFNPTVDRLRVTSRTGQNYRLNPNDGALAFTDGTLAYAASPEPNTGVAPQVATVAYTNSLGTATATTLYFYDFGLNTLGTIIPPNNGTLNTVGSTGITANNVTGLDLDITTNQATGVNTAYLSADVSGTANNLYTVNLTTGATTLIGAIGGGKITEMAVYLPPMALNKLVYAVSGANLIAFNSSNPAVILSTVALTGLGVSETILGMDFRPATGQLYALGSASRLYTINPATGAATQVGTDGVFTLTGTKFGFDFNPVPDRIRVVSDADQNLRLNPNDGTLTATDGTLAYATGDVNAAANPTAGAAAYTNSFGGATATTLYVYDYTLDILGISNPPNNGTLNTVGASGLALLDQSLDMDIASDQATGANIAFLSANLTTTATLFYRVNLSTGTTALLGTVGGGLPIAAMAVYVAPPPPVKMVYALSTTGNLISFNANAPGTILSTVSVTGIAIGQIIEGLDFRPANNQLYALGYDQFNGQAQLYTVNTTTGVAIPVSVTPVTLAANMGKLAVDFNPVVDRLRVVGSTGQNYRLNADNGTIAVTDSSLRYIASDVSAGTLPAIHGVAYTNNFAGTTGTTLYYYDFNLDKIAATIPPASPNLGMISSVGISGIGAVMNVDIDITSEQATGNNTAFLTADVTAAGTNFYLLNLATGEAKLIDTIGTGIAITEMAVLTTEAVLPLTLTDFGVKKEGINSALSWTTQNEVNSDYFILERSKDGRTFTAVSNKINSKAVNGNSSGEIDYAFTDFAPVKGINYYRLQQVDKDGTIKYSQIVQVTFDGKYEIKLYPNPLKNMLNVNAYLAENTDLQIRFTDAGGKVISVGNFKNQKGDWRTQIGVSQLQRGMYFIQISAGNQIIHTQGMFKD